jgi:hypothetical protein
VHTLLMLFSVLLVVVGSCVALGLLSHFADWSRRRTLQCWVLAIPMLSLVLNLGIRHHFADQNCFLTTPVWDSTLSTILPVGMGLIALSGFVISIIRLMVIYCVVNRRGVPASTQLQALAERFAAQFGMRQPRLLLYAADRPLAFVYGLRRPTVVLSAWMVKYLDRRELEAVLAHELGHVVQRDYLLTLLTTMLRDAFFYLPTSRRAYRQLQGEKELACDDLAIHVTSRPLALASALARVWQQALTKPMFGMAQPFIGGSQLLERRIERLLAGSYRVMGKPHPGIVSLGSSVWAAGVLLLFEAVNVTMMLALMDCGPVAWLQKVLQ